jgi:hypothetical protein
LENNEDLACFAADFKDPKDLTHKIFEGFQVSKTTLKMALERRQSPIKTKSKT